MGQALILTTPQDADEALFWATPEHLLMPCYRYKLLLLVHPWVPFETPTTISSATLLPDDNLQVLIHDCHKMKRWNQVCRSYDLGWSQVLQPREQNWPALPRLSDREKESPLPYTETVAMLLLQYMSTVPHHCGGKDIKTKKNARRWWPIHLIPTLPSTCFHFIQGQWEAYSSLPHLVSFFFSFFLLKKAPRYLLYRNTLYICIYIYNILEKLFSHFPIFLLLNVSDIKDIITPC